MAITSAICTSFKVELLKGVHNFTATTGDTFKIALYDSDATLGASTTAFSTSEEITNLECTTIRCQLRCRLIIRLIILV